MNRSEQNSHEITQMLLEWNGGDRSSLDKLLPFVYDELHRQAARYLRRERRDHTLQTTALINEAYLKLIDQREVNWESRTHFFAIAAQAMRRILVDYAKAKHRAKRGGGDIQITFDEAALVTTDEKSIDLIALDEALNRLAIKDKQQARVVELRYFSGLNLEETAKVLEISRITAARDWAMAKAWIRRELTR
ncbi:MAG: sigma-70 family RNA polymerase sigma factor [Acidobacteriota bacterium]|nr:sigma-70 family RNA polymerase sigma factor [Acidobacteriota bacterium]